MITMNELTNMVNRANHQDLVRGDEGGEYASMHWAEDMSSNVLALVAEVNRLSAEVRHREEEQVKAEHAMGEYRRRYQALEAEYESLRLRYAQRR